MTIVDRNSFPVEIRQIVIYPKKRGGFWRQILNVFSTSLFHAADTLGLSAVCLCTKCGKELWKYSPPSNRHEYDERHKTIRDHMATEHPDLVAEIPEKLAASKVHDARVFIGFSVGLLIAGIGLALLLPSDQYTLVLVAGMVLFGIIGALAAAIFWC